LGAVGVTVDQSMFSWILSLPFVLPQEDGKYLSQHKCQYVVTGAALKFYSKTLILRVERNITAKHL